MATDVELMDQLPSSAASFLDPPASLSKDCLSVLSKLFEITVANCSSSCPSPPLSQLYSGDGFGPDEVWAELELLNEPLIRHLQQQVASLGRLREIRLLQQQHDDRDQEDSLVEAATAAVSEDDQVDDDQDQEDDDQDQDQEDDDQDQDPDKEDRFFNLESMEEFVNSADNGGCHSLG